MINSMLSLLERESRLKRDSVVSTSASVGVEAWDYEVRIGKTDGKKRQNGFGR